MQSLQIVFDFSMSNIAVKLTAKAEKIIKKGHPWVFSESIVKLNKEGGSGDVAILFSRRSNQIYAIGLWDPESAVRIKIIHHGSGVQIDSSFFKMKIEQAYDTRQPLLEKNTNAYRLIFGENDGFPGMIVDVYNGVGVIKLYSMIWFPYLEIIVPHLAEIAKMKSLVLRLSRKLQRQNTRYREGEIVYGALDNPEVVFEEYGVRFKTHVIVGHKTGFFLDHRVNRREIGRKARGKTVLDVFSYAGGFSIHALAGGAREVTSIDFSAQALELAKENAKLNPHTGKYHTIHGDAFDILKKLREEEKTYDIIVIDPPSFAKQKKEKEIAKKKYAELTQLGVGLARENSLLLLASCSSRITEEELMGVHEEVFSRLGISYRIEAVTGHDIDHPVVFEEGAYLKTIYYRIL